MSAKIHTLKIYPFGSCLRRLGAFAFIAFTAACADEKVESRSYPVVDTKDVSDVNEHGATLNGEILDTGDGATDHGFLFNKSPVLPATIDASDRISLGPTETAGKFATLANRNLASSQTYYVRAYAVSKKGTVVFGQELTFVSQGSEPPKFIDINPKAASVGDSILVTGSGFSDYRYNNLLRIGSQVAAVYKSKPDSLWATVPLYVPAGENSIEIEVGQQKIQPSSKFKLLPISLISIEPSAVTFTDTVVIHGTNFPQMASSIAVTLFGKPAPVIRSTRNQIRVAVPAEPGVTASVLKILAGIQAVQSTTEIVLSPPQITFISPTKGNKDTEVTITGDNFHPTAAKNKVVMAGKTLDVLAASRKSLTVKIPTGIVPGSYAFTVTTAGQTKTSEQLFQIITPTITQVSPLNGTWGTVVTITGENFGPNIADNLVSFGNEQGTIITASSTEIKVAVPNSVLTPSSTIKVVAITADSRTATYPMPFELDVPEITSLNPLEGKGQAVITIKGKNFNPVPANQVVKFGDFTAVVVSATGTELSVKLPESLAEATVFPQITVATQKTSSPVQFNLLSPWRKVTQYPGPERSNATAFALNGAMYIGFGESSETSTAKKFFKYDPATNQWIQLANYSTSFGTSEDYQNVCGFATGSFGYVGVGSFGSFDQGTFRKYDPASDKWTVAQTLTDKVTSAVGFSIGDKGYVAMGQHISNVLTGRLWEYSPASDTWTAKKSLPGPPRSEAAVFTLNSKAYVTGGYACFNCSTLLKDTWEYDPATDTWTEKAGLPVARRNAMGFSINGKGYIVGGIFSGGTETAELFVYDPVQNQWQKLPNFPGGVLSNGVAVAIGGKAYVGTGTIAGQPTRDIWEFDPSKL